MIRRLTVVALLLPGLGLALAGCGDDTGAADPAPSTVTVTRTVTQDPVPTGGTSTAAPTSPATSDGSAQPSPTDTSVDLSQPPETFDAAMAHIATATGSVTAKRFATPDGNLYCALSVKYVPTSCELAEGTIPDPDYCGNGPAATAIGRIELDKGVPTPVCNSDTIRQPGATTLDDGMVATDGAGLECLSESIGVTCVDTTARSGFFLAKGAYQLFSPGG